MPGPLTALSQGQNTALLMVAAGTALLWLGIALQDRGRQGSAARVRSFVAGALLVTAALALLLVRRLDPAALSRVMANFAAAVLAAAAAERTIRWSPNPGRPTFQHARRHEAVRLTCPPLGLSKELS